MVPSRDTADPEHTPSDARRPVLLVVDDDERLLRLLARLLVAEGFAVIEASEYARALAIIEEREVDGALVDQCLPHGSGLAILDQLRLRRSAAALALMTGEVVGEFVNRVGEIGARAYRKPFGTKELRAFLAEARASHWRRQSPVDRLSPALPLSPRERECFERALVHQRQREIATALGISPATVKSHVRSALNKVGVSTVEEARALVRVPPDET